MVGEVGVDPTTPKERFYRPPRLPIRYSPIMVLKTGLEPVRPRGQRIFCA